MASTGEYKFEPEIQIEEERNSVDEESSNIQQQEQELQNNYCSSNLENQTLINYYTKCGEILVKNGEFLINCCICYENFTNFHYFSKHYNDFHEFYDISQVGKNLTDFTSSIPQQNHNDKLEQSFSKISINHQQSQSKTQYTTELSDDSSDVEVIEIGECKYTVKKIPSNEDLTKLNTNQTTDKMLQQNNQENQKRIFEFCPECNKLFVNLNDLKEHLMNYHEKDRPHKCEYCGKTFRLRESLKEHVRSIHELILPFKCEICNRGFFKSSALKIHIRGHTGERPFVCEICQKSFKSKGALNEHKYIHTGHKRYACQFCNKAFLHSSSLKKHERIHTGECPYICEICFTSFRTLDSLKEHMRTHDDNTPYKCRLCDEQFSHRIQLTEHNRIHNGLDPKVKKRRRPCKCEICGKVLSRKSNLRTHLRNTHRLLESKVEEMMNNLNDQPTTEIMINMPEFDENNFKNDEYNHELEILQTIC